jgi:AAA domain
VIEVIGIEDTREHYAAKCIEKALLALWPDLASTSAEEEMVRIASGVKLSSGKVTDIDVVVAGFLKPGRYVQPRRVLRDKNGRRISGTPIRIENFAVAVEVKDQSSGATRFLGDKVEVYYSRGASKGWKSATDQNIDQVHALKTYFSDAGQDAYVHRCLIMQGLDSVDVDTAVAAGFSAIDFFTAMLAGSPPSERNGRYFLLSSPPQKAAALVQARIFRPLVPTSLDRVRMDRLIEKRPVVEQLVATNGHKFTCLRGHGGTGKTVTFLQTAWKAYKEGADRTLLLTYNHALAADIRRLLALIGVPSGEDGGIVVQTAMSFFYSWLHKLGVTDTPDESFSEYKDRCTEALSIINGGAIGQQDLISIKQSSPDRFDFDRIMVDEAQDWPSYEISLLKSLYDPRTIAVADGVDQLIRGEKADWLQGTTRDSRLLINLTHCLRMKRNLAVFAQAVANRVCLNLDMLPNEKAGGGRVILVKGDWRSQRQLHDELSYAAKQAKNEPVDSLFCVPSSSISLLPEGRTSSIALTLRDWGLAAWDGVDDTRRKDFPRSTSEYRVVHYQSCRGLEGWNVILEHLDDFWVERFRAKQTSGLTSAEANSLNDLEDLAYKQAWRWTFIALTRPIDTLVITLSNLDNPCAKALLNVASDLPDLIDNRID